ncbi:MAG: LysM peptidoglycan-binding domain-containing protein [Ardenticatenaceae bacterium]|nr:LysM peptidoglycan-binding domain-containing protein [Ardenticatenaceae bacterium]
MNLAALLQFIPLVAGVFLAYHLVFKKDLPSKSILSLLTYILGIIIVFFAASWLISTFFASWATGLLNAGTQSGDWQLFIDASGNVVDEALGTGAGGGGNTGAALQTQPTPVQVQVETVVITPTPGPGTAFGTADGSNRTGPTQYTIQAGDTLTKIAGQFGVSVNDIMRANNMMDGNYIQPGQILIIPAPTQ